MEQQGLPLDDKFPVISFLNRVNEIGVKMRPDLFDDSHEFKEVKPGEFVEETIDKDSVILDDSHPRLLKRSNTPIKDLEDDEELHSDINLHQLIRHILHKSESKEEQSITEKFCHLFKYLQRKVKEIIDWLKTAGEKLLIKLFANKKQINHIFGDDWKNFGETLLNTPNFIFSDDTKNPEGFLLYEGGQFYIQNGDKKVKVAPNELDFKHKHHFKSPKTKEHLKAITKLAEIKNKKVRVFGSCHSWSPIHNTNGILVDNRKIGTNEKGEHNCELHEQDKRTDHPKISKKGQLRPTVTCSPGITTGKLELWLWDRKYSLEASTIEDVFTMGGICFTSSHGTGKKFTVSSDLVIALTIVCSNGKVVEISPHECVEVDGDKRSPATWLLEKGGVKLTPEDVWRAAQVNLGAFGIIYDMTILVRPQMYALFVSEAGRWNDYFGQDPSCVKKLSDLNDEWETLEFWHYPLTIDEEDHPSLTKIFTGKVTYCPFVTITKTMTDQLTEEQSKIYNVVEKDMNSKEMIAQLALQSVGSRFASKMWKWANNLYNSKLFSKLGRLIIKYIVVMVGWVGKIRWGKEPVYKDGHLVEKGEIWKIPQWMANHPVLDATAVVEKIPCLDIEWEFNVPSFDTNGLKDTVHAYGHLIRSCVESFKKDEYPVSINCEMRFLRGSCSPMSMQYNHQPLYDSEEGGEKADRGYAAPEIVSNSPNPWWKSFYEKMNKEVTGIGQKDKKFGDHVRVHHAKQYSSLPGMLKYIREIYDDPKFSSYPHTTLNTSFKLWKEVRTRFDVSGAFINTHVDQLFYNLKDTYHKEEGTEIDEGGNVHKKESPCSIL